MWYKAEFEDDNFEMILANSDNDAFEQAEEIERECETLLFNIFLVDEGNNIIKRIF